MAESAPAGLMVEFDSDTKIVAAAKSLIDLGFRKLDGFTPRPIDELQDLIVPERSTLPRTVLVAGVVGALTGLGTQWFCNTWDYPLNVGGRPPFSLPAFIPITFEIMVLFASLAAFFGALHRARLPNLTHPVFGIPNFESASIDHFWLFVSRDDACYREGETEQLMRDAGCVSIVDAPSTAEPGSIPLGPWIKPTLAILLCCCSLFGAIGCDDLLPRIGLERMKDQSRGKAYRASPFFADGKLMQAPPSGTVPTERPQLPREVSEGLSANGYVAVVPVPIDHALLERGRDRFEIFCATCHGIDGSGNSLVAHNMSLRKPPSLVVDPVRSYLPGHVFEVITAGDGLMPSYAHQLSLSDRWAVVSYLHALQRSQATELATLPASLRNQAEEALR